MKYIFIECRRKSWVLQDIDMAKLLEVLKNYNKIGLITTVQHIEDVNVVKKFLKKNGKTVLIGKPGKPKYLKNKAKYDCQVLGCDSSAAEAIKDKADCLLYIGTGRFHAIGASMDTKKLTIIFNPISSKIEKIGDEQKKLYLARKAIAIANAKKAGKFGIIVSTKPGQHDINSARKVKDFLEKKGREAHIFVFDEIVPESLLNFPDIEMWINTACPRIALEDAFRFRKSILNAKDVLKLIF